MRLIWGGRVTGQQSHSYKLRAQQRGGVGGGGGGCPVNQAAPLTDCIKTETGVQTIPSWGIGSVGLTAGSSLGYPVSNLARTSNR